ncbi:zinc-binding dehydrogenase [Nocardia goodfellowii]|uniref:NADPH:quinone reductase-like Zn-dependent oxidoreductase n=1 Tax=Nocardia goodfellowii TaxID=882446 RepID=A0ABS4QKW9_9NOCA|nr:zinc-binding dehydrogenase [Nocardia goodfellowii]MBP2192342.1 NADPH:quinone reductase-like Zn-dependent oxidoreductase [Nocardia goodfellowii]
MHAIRLHAFGPAENLRYETVGDPAPGAHQVRITVAAAGVHLVDTALRHGRPGPYPLPELPTIPGREVAGTVESVGAEVDSSWLGKRVVTHLGSAPGGYAELAIADSARLHVIPENLDPAEAIAMIGTGRTTMGILQFTDLGPDSVAVVTAAAGGIGTLLVQAAKNAGAYVIGLAGGPGKVARVAENGADLAVDYLRPGWDERLREYRPTVVFDAVGGEIARAAVDLLRTGGHHVVYGFPGGPLGISEREQRERGITSQVVLGPPMMQRAGGDIRVLEDRSLAEAAAGRLRPAVQRFPLADAAGAHRALETRATMGKVVLIP